MSLLPVQPLLLLVLACGLGLASGWGAEQAAKPNVDKSSQTEHLVLLHINDTHGRLGPHAAKGRSLGGVGRLAGLVKQIRRENPGRVLLLHGGDVFSDGDSLTRRYKGQVNIALMNRIGFDAMVAGNGDYYRGLENLKQRMAEAEFAVLAGNIFQQTTEGPKAVGKEFVLKQVGPLRVGMLGVSMIRPEHPSSRNLKAGKSIELANKWLKELEGQTDLLVVLSHLGANEDTMLAGMLKGVHIVVGGHTHTALNSPMVVRKPKGSPGQVYIVQAGEYYESLGRVDLEFVRAGETQWKLVKVSGKLIALDETVEPDEEILRQLEEYRQAMRQNKDLPVASGDQVPAESQAKKEQSPQAVGAGGVWP